jgi:malonyl-CoA O-methyltransferase
MKSNIQAAYNRWSLTYDVQENMTRDLDAAVLPHIVPDLAGRRVVEAGCGTGKNSNWLAARCRALVALDFSEGMMALARRKVTADNVTWARCDLNRPWPLAGETADLVIFNLVLEHIEALEPVFSEAGRTLRVGGQMVLSEYHPERLTDGLGARITDEAGEIVELVGSFRHTAEDYETAAAACGLGLIERREWEPSGEKRPLLLTMRFEKG